jgi:hypothetical protein
MASAIAATTSRIAVGTWVMSAHYRDPALTAKIAETHFPNGPPDYTNFARDTIGGTVSVKHLRTCWAGFNSNSVGGSVIWNDNQGSPLTGDANLMDGNSIGGNLICFNNNPTPHLSDNPLQQTLNTIGGVARGQCEALAA